MAKHPGAMMTRCLRAFLAAVLASGFFGTSALAQAPLNESPITPGFWSFPGHRAVSAQDVIATCRNHFEIRFADGRFIGMRTHKTERGLVQREIEDVGRCAFNREAQIDNCDVKHTNPDGSILVGTTESRYAFDAHKNLKMIVTPKMITDTPFSDAPFDAFPARCPDDALWSILNEAGPPR
jgi:hypothetical protein